MNSATPAFFDSHCHLQWEEDGHSVDQQIQRARRAGVRDLLCVAVDLPSALRAREIASGHEGIRATVGIHPNDLPAAPGAITSQLQLLEDLAGEPGWVAIGETGLDHYRDRVPAEVQRQAFRFHLALAHDLALPVVIHCRAAAEECLAALRAHGAPIRGVMHCYSGDPEGIESFLELGLHISFAGNLTYPRSEPLRLAARLVPADRLLVETDSPFLAPQAQRGKRNEPANLPLTARCLAEIREETLSELAATTRANAERLFGTMRS